MNLYFLVEGRRTERKVYPRWLSYLLPRFTQVDRFDVVDDNNYFLISGEGYPSLLDIHLPNAIKDFNQSLAYSHLVVCLDADEATVADRIDEVEKRITENPLVCGEVEIVVQNRSIETWFLGNRRMLARHPQSPKLADFIRFYDVSLDDPEQMGIFPGFSNHAKSHEGYLREMFLEKNIRYSKRYPGHVADEAFLKQLTSRIDDEPQHLVTFRSFVSFCKRIDSNTGLS